MAAASGGGGGARVGAGERNRERGAGWGARGPVQEEAEVGLAAARGRRPSAIAKAATGGRERGPLAVALAVKYSTTANVHL